MSKRALLIFLLGFAAMSIWPAAAQDDTIRAADYVPADFAGLIQVRLDNPQETLQGLNIAAFIASQLQPNRVQLGANALGYDDFIPFSTLFDVENTSFLANILPWVEGELIIAYREFDGLLQADSSDVLLVLPTSNVLESAAGLSAIISQQDLLTRQTYRGVDVYEGDKTSIALTSPAIFIGGLEVIHAALDVQAGVTTPISENPIYSALRAASDEDPLIFAYVNGGHILPVVSGLLGGDPESEVLYTAFGTALANLRADDSFETLLLNNGFDGAAASLDTVIETSEAIFTAKAVFHRIDSLGEEAQPEYDASLMDMIPRNALLATGGANATGFVYDLMTALPLSNFTRQMFGGLPIQTLGSDSELVTVPNAEEVQSAVNQYITMLGQLSGFDLQADLIDHLAGSYAVGLIPRPNNPVPVINTPFDILIAARVESDAVLDGATNLLQNLFALDPLEDETLDEWNFARLGTGNETVFRLGVKDGTLLIATGDAAQSALDAARGDNRLVDQESWQTLSESARPDLYIDTASFYNTFFPAAGGAVPDNSNRSQLALYNTYQGDGIYELKFSALIPTGG
jgi:hypothetical protein